VAPVLSVLTDLQPVAPLRALNRTLNVKAMMFDEREICFGHSLDRSIPKQLVIAQRQQVAINNRPRPA